jgi:hypothetical protein
MKDEIWIKIGLPGADPQLGTLQGRINKESFSKNTHLNDLTVSLNQAITDNLPIKLFDPIVFRAQKDPQTGNIMLGALSLTDSMPDIQDNFFYLNPSNIMWWAPLQETENWKNVVASTIHRIEIAGGNALPEFDIPTPKGPRLVR